MQPHEEWLYKARNDLKAANILLSGEEIIGDTAVYHTQQCAEKSLKAFLAFHERPIPLTHDLEKLLETCSEINEAFGSLLDDAITLTPYATLFRYPDVVMEPEKEDVSDAIQRAENIFLFVIQQLPESLSFNQA